MLEKIKTYLLYGKHYASIEFTSYNGNEVLFGVTAKRKKGEFINVTSLGGKTTDQITGYLPKGMHCYLSITTDKVLINELPQGANKSNLIREAFPGLKHEDFYHEVFNTSKKAFIAVCRKQYVDELLEKFEKAKIHVVGFGLGFGKLKNVIKHINADQITTSRFIISKEEDEIYTYSEIENPINETYQISDIAIGSSHLIPLAGLSGYHNNRLLTSNNEEKNKSLFSHFSETVFFKKGLITAAAIFIGVLTINAVLFTDYHNKLSRLREESKVVLAQKERFSSKQEEIAKKEKIVKNILLSGNSRSIFYSNRIVNSLPESISLSLLEFQPLQNSLRPDKPIQYKKAEIIVRGKSLDKQQFNNWISLLNSMDWIEKISTHSYTEKNNSAEFGITLTTKDEAKD